VPVHIGLVGEQLRSESALRALPGCVVLLPLVTVYAFDVPSPAPERLADITGVSRGSLSRKCRRCRLAWCSDQSSSTPGFDIPGAGGVLQTLQW
jgi:hypothetical protein